MCSINISETNPDLLRAVTGFEFGDNEAAVPKTEDNGVAEVSFQVGNCSKVIIYSLVLWAKVETKVESTISEQF